VKESGVCSLEPKLRCTGPYAGLRTSISGARGDAIRALANSISLSQQPLNEIVISRSAFPEKCRRGGW